MELDTRDDRGSVIGMGISVVLPVPDGDINEPDRRQVAGLYRASLIEVPSDISVTQISVGPRIVAGVRINT